MLKTTVNLLGKNWRVIVRSDRVHKKQFKKCHAITICHEHTIYIRKSSLDITTLTHEIVHAYEWALSFYELDLTKEQIQEWYCELIAKYGEQIHKDSRRIFDLVNK